MQLINSETKLPWFCFGGGSKPFTQMESFQNTISSCGLNELNTFGVKFTWLNKRLDSTYTKEKLDGVLATKEALPGLPESYSLLFCKVNSLKWSKMVHLLALNESASGQLLNKDKISIYFSPNTPRDIRSNIIKISGVKATGSFEKYLGLLLLSLTKLDHFKAF